MLRRIRVGQFEASSDLSDDVFNFCHSIQLNIEDTITLDVRVSIEAELNRFLYNGFDANHFWPLYSEELRVPRKDEIYYLVHFKVSLKQPMLVSGWNIPLELVLLTFAVVIQPSKLPVLSVGVKYGLIVGGLIAHQNELLGLIVWKM